MIGIPLSLWHDLQHASLRWRHAAEHIPPPPRPRVCSDSLLVLVPHQCPHGTVRIIKGWMADGQGHVWHHRRYSGPFKLPHVGSDNSLLFGMCVSHSLISLISQGHARWP